MDGSEVAVHRFSSKQNKRFQKFLNIQRQTPMLESLFHKTADLKGPNLINPIFL